MLKRQIRYYQTSVNIELHVLVHVVYHEALSYSLLGSRNYYYRPGLVKFRRQGWRHPDTRILPRGQSTVPRIRHSVLAVSRYSIFACTQI